MFNQSKQTRRARATFVIDKANFDLICARKMLNATEVCKAANIQKATLYKAFYDGVGTKSIGKIAHALDMDVLDLIVKE